MPLDIPNRKRHLNKSGLAEAQGMCYGFNTLHQLSCQLQEQYGRWKCRRSLIGRPLLPEFALERNSWSFGHAA